MYGVQRDREVFRMKYVKRTKTVEKAGFVLFCRKILKTEKMCYNRNIPSLTLYKAKNSHNPSVYQGCGCFRFCINMYYF